MARPKLKKRYTLWLSFELIKKVKAHANRLKVSQANLIESLIIQGLGPQSAEEAEALIVRRLNQIDRRQLATKQSLDIIAESHAMFVRMWLSHHPEIPASQQQVAATQAQERFKKFVKAVSGKLQTADKIFQEY